MEGVVRVHDLKRHDFTSFLSCSLFALAVSASACLEARWEHMELLDIILGRVPVLPREMVFPRGLQVTLESLPRVKIFRKYISSEKFQIFKIICNKEKYLSLK